MRATERDSGCSEWELMHRAGRGAAEWIWRTAAGRPVTMLCGPGNNGGDGYVVAESLRRRGLDLAVVAPVAPASDSARTARGLYGASVATALAGRRAPVLVDAFFGFGLTRPVEGVFAEILQQALRNHEYVVAIDVPSGVDCDTGEWLGAPFAADLTLALGAWKRAHWLMPACAAMGERRLVDIGISLPNPPERLSSRPQFSAPTGDSHKYRRGLLAIVAGAMPGAPVLAAEAAMRAGAGYVKLVSVRSHPDAPAGLVIEDDAAVVLSDERVGAVLIGPGLGRDAGALERLTAVLDSGKPAVIDADALHLLDPDALEGVNGSRLLLTPHEGELAALCKAFEVEVTTKTAQAAALRDATGCSVLAKGPDTVFAPCHGGLVLFPRASTWLSTAGTGDVLAGIAASRLAGHDDPARAAEEAVWLHREAARIAGPAFTAGELALAVGPAMARFL